MDERTYGQTDMTVEIVIWIEKGNGVFGDLFLDVDLIIFEIKLWFLDAGHKAEHL